MYILLDLERTLQGNQPYYWKPARRGYTTVFSEAGLYTEEESEKLVTGDFDKLTIRIKESKAKDLLGS